MRNLIFLDVDGVLNTDDTPDRICGYIGIESEKVALLKQIVDAMNAELVLISTWRSEWCHGERPTEIGQYLIDKLAEYGLEIADETPDIEWRKRGKEILQYMHYQIGVDKVLILDDINFNYDRWDIDRYWYCTQDNEVYKMWPGLRQKDVDFIIAHMDMLTWEEDEIED